MNFQDAIKRYENDPEFNKIVSILEIMIMSNKVNVFEIKDALNFAINKLTMENKLSISGVIEHTKKYDFYSNEAQPYNK